MIIKIIPILFLFITHSHAKPRGRTIRNPSYNIRNGRKKPKVAKHPSGRIRNGRTRGRTWTR